MLVLSRKPEENFCFPNLGVNVRVLAVKGRSVRIVDAPKELQILRGELDSTPETIANNHVVMKKSINGENRLNIIKLSLVLAELNFKWAILKTGKRHS